MDDSWHFYPAGMGEDQAYIFFNNGYAAIAEHDPRRNQLRVDIEFKAADLRGLPTNDEFEALSALEDSLSSAIEQLGGIYVGRVSVAGKRYFYFFVDRPEQVSVEAAEGALQTHGYRSVTRWTADPAKDGYWKDLYPTADDWQVIKDIGVLEQLSRPGDDPDRERPVDHWAYFESQQIADHFATWLQEQNYQQISTTIDSGQDRTTVHFRHIGTMQLGDIIGHTIALNRQAMAVGGEYDGWETSVEKAPEATASGAPD